VNEARFVPLDFRSFPPDEMAARARAFRDEMRRRRTVRQFSDRPVPREIVAACLLAAGSAPNGANKQPWHFVAVSDPGLKRAVREAAEAEERRFYAGRASADWLRDLEPLGTDAQKPFLETAPWLIAIFEQRHGVDAAGARIRHYYTKESVGIATGLLIAALHHAGLATLTHTPNPMGFLNRILERPSHEKPFLLLVVGHPAGDAVVPAITKKPLDEIATFR
jgi:nitroreductase